MRRFAHAQDAVGFPAMRRAKMCARMQRVGATGQGQGHSGARVLVLGEACGRRALAGVQAGREGAVCYMFH